MKFFSQLALLSLIFTSNVFAKIDDGPDHDRGDSISNKKVSPPSMSGISYRTNFTNLDSSSTMDISSDVEKKFVYHPSLSVNSNLGNLQSHFQINFPKSYITNVNLVFNYDSYFKGCVILIKLHI